MYNTRGLIYEKTSLTYFLRRKTMLLVLFFLATICPFVTLAGNVKAFKILKVYFDVFYNQGVVFSFKMSHEEAG